MREPKADRVTTTIRIEPSLVRELKQAALDRDVSFNDLVLEYLRTGIARERRRAGGNKRGSG
jgi:hypothetical protein